MTDQVTNTEKFANVFKSNLSLIHSVNVDTSEIEDFGIGQIVRMREEEDRMELDEDGMYLIVGLQADVGFGWSTTCYKKKLQLACANGLCERKPGQVVGVEKEQRDADTDT